MSVEISNSEMQTFRDCRRKWWLQYVRRLQPLRVSKVGPLPLGTRVHAALEAHYAEGADLLSAYRDLTDHERLVIATEGLSDEKFEDEAELGRIMLEGYLKWVEDQGLDSDLEVIGVEEILRYPVPLRDGSEATLLGKIDLRIVRKVSNTRAVLDFKTAASFNLYHDVSHMTTQLKTYLLLDRLAGSPDTRVDAGIFRLLKKVKRTARATPPFYEEMFVSHNDYTLRNFWHQLQGILLDITTARKAIEAGENPMVHAYPNATADCRWKCPFVQICPMFDDGSDVDSAINDMYVEGDPYAYYGDKKDEV